MSAGGDDVELRVRTQARIEQLEAVNDLKQVLDDVASKRGRRNCDDVAERLEDARRSRPAAG